MSRTASPSFLPESRLSVRPACLSRGEPWREAPLAHGPDRGERVTVYSCGLLGECTEHRVTDKVQCCASCPHYRPRDLAGVEHTPQNSLASMMEALRAPPRSWPEDWVSWGTTLEAHRRLAAEYQARLPPYPAGRFAGRGIVIPGGGPFFAGVYVTVRMLRHFGCRLPIEVWHHGRREPIVPHWLEPFGVRIVDTDAHMNTAPEPPRLRGGWTSKMYVLLNTSFEEVLFLDSDCYPVRDVTPLFDLNNAGSILWPNPPYCDPAVHWYIYGTEPSKRPPVNSGIMLVDKARCWSTLLMAQWWNDHADYTYSHGCGDQDVVRGVWQQQRQPWTHFADAPARSGTIHVDLGPDNAPWFVHRINDKFRLPGMPIRSSGNEDLYRKYALLGETQFDATLPQEAVAFQAFRQFLWMVDNDPLRYRPGTMDRFNWEETVLANAYQLPQSLPRGSRVVDVGAHIGSFSHLALRRGAARVWAFEADPDNHEHCARHLRFWGDRVALRRQAVWSHRGRAGFQPMHGNNAAGRVFPGGDAVDTVAIDDILDEASENGSQPIHLLKLDCEGSEWPILFVSRRLRLCEQIVGEYHPGMWRGRECIPEDLYRVLASHGFQVRTHAFSTRQGLFWAVRNDHRPGATVCE